MITTETGCRSAAVVLALTFGSVAGAEWASGCIFHGGSVHFSPHEDGSTQNPTDGYICADESAEIGLRVVITPFDASCAAAWSAVFNSHTGDYDPVCLASLPTILPVSPFICLPVPPRWQALGLAGRVQVLPLLPCLLALALVGGPPRG